MTTCTICRAPCPGTDDDDAPCCSACYAANLAGAELRPRGGQRELPRPIRVWRMPWEDGERRETWDARGN